MTNLLFKLKADIEFQTWANGKSWYEIFANCPNGEWLLWLFQKSNPEDIRFLTLAKGHCANTMHFFMKNENDKFAVDSAINFGEGKISLSELNSVAKEAAERVSYYNLQFENIKKEFDYEYDAELDFTTGFSEALSESHHKADVSNAMSYYFAAIGSDAVNVNAPADNVAYNTSQCIYEIVYNNGPFEFVDYSKALDLQLLSDLDFYKFSYLNYINNFISTCINDTEEIAKIKNQLSTADTCRKFLPIKIWNITFQNLNLSDSQFTFKI